MGFYTLLRNSGIRIRNCKTITYYVIIFGQIISTIHMTDFYVAFVHLFPPKHKPTGEQVCGNFTDVFELESMNSTLVVQGIYLSSYYITFSMSHFMGVWLAARMSPKILISIVYTCTSISKLVFPLIHIEYLQLTLRFGEGLFAGLLIPSMLNIFNNWQIQTGSGIMCARFAQAKHFGIGVTFMAYGPLLHYYHWKYAFFLSSCLGCCWLFLWLFISADSPEQHPFITDEEMDNILVERVYSKPRRLIPWMAIVLSIRVWALALTSLGAVWLSVFLSMSLEIYLIRVHGLTLLKVGLIVGSVFVGSVMIIKFYACLTAFMIYKGLRVDIARKIWITIALGMPALFLYLVTLDHCNTRVVFPLLAGVIVFESACHVSIEIVPYDLSPTFPYAITSVVSFFTHIAGVGNGLLMVLIISVEDWPKTAWSKIMWVPAGVAACAAIFYLFVGKSKKLDLDSYGTIDIDQQEFIMETHRLKTDRHLHDTTTAGSARAPHAYQDDQISIASENINKRNKVIQYDRRQSGVTSRQGKHYKLRKKDKHFNENEEHLEKELPGPITKGNYLFSFD